MSDSLQNQNKILLEQRDLTLEQNEHLQRQIQATLKQNKILSEQTEKLHLLQWTLNQSRLIQESMRAGLAAPLLDSMNEFLKNRQLGLLSSLATIRNERLNLARFGDGEFRLMFRLEDNLKFQRNSPELMSDLRNVFVNAQNNPDKLMIGMPHVFHDDRHWASIYNSFWRQVQPLLEPIDRIANSHISRPLVFSVHGETAVDAWRSVWDGLNITVVTGKGSRFDFVPALFDNVRSSRFEYSSPTNAYLDVPRLVETLESDPSDLVLISLGPAGTILASELANRGKWALDIGHLSNSYEFELKDGKLPEHIPTIKDN